MIVKFNLLWSETLKRMLMFRPDSTSLDHALIVNDLTQKRWHSFRNYKISLNFTIILIPGAMNNIFHINNMGVVFLSANI